MKQLLYCLSGLLLGGPGVATAQGIVYPAGTGVVNVKTAYNAYGDGVHDDTRALQAAITNNLGRPVYLPAGTYLVSDRLVGKSADGRWNGGLQLIGQDEATTVIKLQDQAAGYQDPAAPKAVVYTASSLFVEQPYGGGKDYPALGEGNEAFGNYVQHLTIDTGAGNAGAIGLDYLGNNIGAVRHVTLRGAGAVGLSLQRKWPGPCLVQYLTVQGFQYGVRVQQFQYSATLEHLRLSGQTVAGLANLDNVLAIRDLQSTNTVPAVRNDGGNGLLSLVDATLAGGAPGNTAIVSTAHVLLRRVTSSGYGAALTQGGTVRPGSTLAEYSSAPARTLVPGAVGATLDLPVQEAPTYDDYDPTRWVNAVDFGATPDDWNGDAWALRNAINSGAAVVYLPPGRYLLDGTIELPPTLRRLVGFGASLAPGWQAYPDANQPQAMFQVQGNSANPLIVEGLSITRAFADPRSPQPGLIGWENATTRPLVLRDIGVSESKYAYRGLPGAGPLFVENVTAGQWYFGPGQQVWGRQFNAEGGADKIVNEGARLWLLGLKTEGGSAVIRTLAGGQTELLGGLLYPATNVSSTDVAFDATDAEQSLTFATVAYSSAQDYTLPIGETRTGTTRRLTHDQLPGRGLGLAVALYSSRRTSGPLPVVLTSFAAQRSATAAVALRWTTASEVNSARFEVERAAGADFVRVGTVAARGTSAVPTHYEWLDAPAPATGLYYRLRQVDHDGRVQYSPVAVVPPLAAAGLLELFPNPATGLLTLQLPSSATPGTAVVSDLRGRVVARYELDATGATLDVQALAPGTYLLQVVGRAPQPPSTVQRFTKL